MKFNTHHAEVLAAASIAIALRTIVSLYSHSGAGKPPLYGDYEAQRHWQEITTNLPPKDWYRNTSNNDLLYWGLDYPPLTAYHSYLLGVIAANAYNASFIELHKSRGIETREHKHFMRSTVLFADILLYLPALIVLYCCLDRLNSTRNKVKQVENKGQSFMILLAMLLYPGQILIDNGHFQYNNISLGLCLLAVAAISNERIYLASFLYTLALNYKQMELYHALPFFVYLLRTCLEQKRFLQKLQTFTLIAGIVLTTFAVLWLPWLGSLESAREVLLRLFPIGRGVLEDKVANFWCALNVVYKIKKKLSHHHMAILCLGTTASLVVPINMQLFFKKRKETFVLSLVNTAMAFYFFSFQVHEKSILLVAAPALCLLKTYPLETLWFLEVTVFSMFPLFVKDGLVIPFFVLSFIYYICVKNLIVNQFYSAKYAHSWLHVFSSASELGMLLLAVVALVAPPPTKYPFLWPLLICLYSLMHFCMYFIFCLVQQIWFDPNVKLKTK